MSDTKWMKNYFELYNDAIYNDKIFEDLLSLKSLMESVNRKNGKVVLFGNGGSAAIASHVAVDLVKNASIKSTTYNEYDLITCLSNDYGFSRWMEKAIEYYCTDNDLVILISSSGNSENVINAAKKCKEMNIKVTTFTGFDSNNQLKQLGNINFWLDSKAYNIVEMTHQIWLLGVVDAIIGSAEYSAS
jgi:D-sedoheptulose 7-phosphate isomerase